MKGIGRRISIWHSLPLLLVGLWMVSGFSIISAEFHDAERFGYPVAKQRLLMPGDEFARKAILDSRLEKYTVKSGDTLFQISRESFVSLSSLQNINGIADPRKLTIGQILYLPPLDKERISLIKYQLKKGDSLLSIQQDYQLSKWQFYRINSGLGTLKVGDVIYLPKKAKKLEPDSRMLIGFIRPIRGFLTSRFGMRWGRKHDGIDLAAPFGTPVKAAASGQIMFAGWSGGYGLLVVINHGKFRTYYGHLSKILVRKGIAVHQGDLIGKVGATGHAYGNHLHFEVEKNGVKVNPYGYIEKHINSK